MQNYGTHTESRFTFTQNCGQCLKECNLNHIRSYYLFIKNSLEHLYSSLFISVR